MPRIELEHVTKRWGNFVAVDDLTMVIEDREFITLLGPSGCGKTTTLRMIAGLETPTTGRITIGDQVVFDSEAGINVSPAKRDIGFLFQNYALWPHMTVYKNITFGLENLKWKKPEIEARAVEVMQMLKIEEFRNRYPAELSGGQQQRVAIARTLAPRPKVLFMDEPLSNLDAKLRLEMRSELQRLHLDTGSTFVYVTHDQMEAMTLATSICLIDNGVLQQYDAPLTVYNRPNNTFVADFVGNPSINFVEANGAQSGEGIKCTVWDGQQLTFVPNEKIDIAEWHKQDRLLDEQKEQHRQELLADKRNVEKGNKDVKFKCHIAKVDETELEEERELTDNDFVLGIRPEAVKISETGAIEGEIYSAMPTGMETTVRVKIGEYLITGVIFGGVTYQLGQKVRVDFDGDGIMLFSARSGRFITTGSFAKPKTAPAKAAKEENDEAPKAKKTASTKAKSTTTKAKSTTAKTTKAKK